MILKSRGSLLHYPFEGDATDKWGSNNGTVSGATLAVGKFGKCYQFVIHTAKITSAAACLVGQAGFSALAWYKHLGIGYGTYNPILISFNGSSLNRFWVSKAGTLVRNSLNIGGAAKIANLAIPDAVGWHRLGVIWDAAYVYAVCDAVISAGTAAAGVLASGTSALVVADDGIAGLIDEVTIYTRALGLADLKRDMMGLPPIG